MTYEILSEPHTCDLPPAEDFPHGVEIRCTKPRLKNGKVEACGTMYYRDTRGVFSHRAVWEPWGGGW